MGLNIPKPAELLQIYREYVRANGYDKSPSASVGVQTDFFDTEDKAENDEFKQMVCRNHLYSKVYQLRVLPQRLYYL